MTATLSVQLYSLGSAAATDPLGVATRLSGLGYGAVEPAILTASDPVRSWAEKTYGFTLPPPVDIAALRKALDENGLVAPSSHVVLPEGDQADEIFDAQEMLGSRFVVAPHVFDAETGAFETFDDLDRIKRLAERFNVAAERARARGMRIGYHNHSWEFGTDFDGQSGLEVFFGLLEPDVFAEVDIYWTHVAGRDPVDVVTSLGERVLLLHVKDGDGAPDSPSSALGEGVLDLPSILGAAKFAQLHVIELENLADSEAVWSILDSSRRYWLENGLSR